MEIEEQEQSCIKINSQENYKEVSSENYKIVSNIVKQKRKKRVKVQWYPKIQKKLLNYDAQPIYIYFLLKIFKSYDSEEYNRHRYFGYADAGVGKIEQLQLDKIYETVDLQLQIYSQGIDNFKAYQNQLYYYLADTLEQYQKWINEHLKQVFSIFSDKETFSQQLQESIDSAYPDFEQTVKAWAQENFQNELYEIELCTVKFNLAKLTLKKKIFSKNLMMFIGGDLYEIYQTLIEQNLKESITSFLSGGEYNGTLQLEKTIKFIKWMMDQRKQELIIEDEVFTLDGISIPCQKTIKLYYYNYQLKKVIPNPQLHIIFVTHYNFEPHWIKYLIEIREQFQQLPKQIENHYNKNKPTCLALKDFEYICKQEYFLEKFNYIKKDTKS